ncbi:nuclear pore complex protein Nup98-Nup96 isoform X1 [Patella vulgata]|uniref:nuclear pore complex protein Nup98-Nup96 isoform X1 n=2 Tax=Patella vulgata TaxID=6465 RepID=UPI0024A9B7ED|nr:nuclear pore complex protein Nup98-Nup96 isoform X1 [Patella vulgata]XP_055958695.1 nuclear pore complex protein Nup98-Nup96 isoform X1 [Patella vulgata]
MFSGFNNTPSSFGNSFGSAQPAGFGQAANSSFTTGAGQTGGLFGSTNNNTPGLFGNKTSFGGTTGFGATPNTNAAGGLFGGQNTQTAAGGLFSTPNNNAAFGAKTPGFTGFGTNTGTNTGLFGSNTQNTGSTLFGQNTGGTMFGGTAQSTSGTVVKFEPPGGQDSMVKNGQTTSIATRHQCITAMKQYETKSLEELRFEDYGANRKGKQQTAGGLFGGTPAAATQSSTGFGFNANTTGFGGTTGFGAPTSSGSGVFGQQPTQASSTGLFGANKSIFGNTPSTSNNTTGFGFGTTNTSQPSTLFGGGKSLFGATATTQQQPLFGTATGTSTFGGTSFGGNTAFGTPAQSAGNLFGNKPAGFGTTTTASTGLFNNTSSNLFGAKPAGTATIGFGNATATPGFGNTAATGGLFGNKTGFGATPGTTGFNAGGNTFNLGGLNAANTGGMFGNAQNKPGFGFNLNNTGTTNTTTGFGTGLGSGLGNFGGNTSTLGTNTGSTASNSMLQQQLLAVALSPYGDHPLFWNLKPTGAKKEDVLKPTNPTAQRAALMTSSQYKVSPGPTKKVKPKSLHNLLNGGKAQLFEGLGDDDFSFGNDTFVPRKSVKKLVLKKNHDNDDSSSNVTSPYPSNISINNDTSPTSGPVKRLYPDLSISSDCSIIPSTQKITDPIAQTINLEESDNGRILDSQNIIRSRKLMEPINRGSQKDASSLDDTITIFQKPRLSGETSTELNETPTSSDRYNGIRNSIEEQQSDDETDYEPHPAGIVLRRPGYFTVPSLDELCDNVDDNGECIVENFTIGREGYGSVFFPGLTNLTGLNLDEIVHFRRKEVVIYPDDDDKPPLGEGLNKKAEVTLDCVWPADKSTRSPIKSVERLTAMNYQEKIEEITAKIGAKFIDYRPETGSWVFGVKHFSKYGLVDDSDDENTTEAEKKQLKTAQTNQQLVQKQKIQQHKVQGEGQNGELLKGQGLLPMTTGDGDTGKDQVLDISDEDADMSDVMKGDGQVKMEAEDDDDLKSIPSSHRLASQLGVGPQNMQVMKASFFTEDDYGDLEKGKLSTFTKSSGHASPLLKQAEKNMPSLFNQSLMSKYSSPLSIPRSPLPTDIEMESKAKIQKLFTPEPRKNIQHFISTPHPEYLHIHSGMKESDYPRRIVGSRIQREIPPVEESMVYNQQKLLLDSGCYMGRSFRVGWGPGWALAHSGTTVYQSIEDKAIKQAPFSLLPSNKGNNQVKSSGRDWLVAMEKVDVADYFSPEDKQFINHEREMLSIQLKNSVNTIDNGCPLFATQRGVTALHEYSTLTDKTLKDLKWHPDEGTIQHMSMVFNLCVALWGNMPGYQYHSEDVYAIHQARREMLSQWLSNTGADKIYREVNESKFKTNAHLEAIFSHLTGGQIAEACLLAQQSGDHRLALLLAQSAGSCISKQLLEQQLQDWKEVGANEFIKKMRLRLYILLSGQLVLSTTDDDIINICEDLDWKRAFALHLWFKCKSNALIEEALQEYDEAFQGSDQYRSYAQPPLPPYLESMKDKSGEEEEMIYDTCYHILKLYSDHMHRLEKILNPVTSTSQQLDYRLSWHLLQVLQGLNYHHLSPYLTAAIHISFSAQLESIGLWEWAVFVVLHIHEAQSRIEAVKSLLTRHVELSTDNDYIEKESFILEELLVPSIWIHEAKAVKARYERKHDEEVDYLLQAEKWNEAHLVILEHIASDAIINENYDYLMKFLQELCFGSRSCSVLNWSTGGKVFYDYINLCYTLEQLKQDEQSICDLDKLQLDVQSLCVRVGGLNCRNARDKLCQCEMAKKSANLLRTLVTLQDPTGIKSFSTLAPYICKLPLPEDDCLLEVSELTQDYLREKMIIDR